MAQGQTSLNNAAAAQSCCPESKAEGGNGPVCEIRLHPTRDEEAAGIP